MVWDCFLGRVEELGQGQYSLQNFRLFYSLKYLLLVSLKKKFASSYVDQEGAIDITCIYQALLHFTEHLLWRKYFSSIATMSSQQELPSDDNVDEIRHITRFYWPWKNGSPWTSSSYAGILIKELICICSCILVAFKYDFMWSAISLFY